MPKSNQPEKAAATVPGAQPAPFIIWTFRRTGGTNLGRALFERAPFQGAQHEPFNADRAFGQVTREWLANRDEAALRAALTDICSRQVLIKHCLEVTPPVLNRLLAEAATAAGYRHLFLCRRRPLDRLLSLHFARRSGIWGKEQARKAMVDAEIFRAPLPIDELVAHEEACRKEMLASFTQLRQLGANPLVLNFEDLYVSDDVAAARRQVRAVLAALGLARGNPEDRRFLDQVLARGGQGTRDKYLQFADYDQLAAALEPLGEFDLRAAAAARRAPAALPPAVAKLAVWDTHADPRNGGFVVSGIVLPAPAAPAGCRLLIEDANGCREVRWGLPSPKLAARLPGNPAAARARFRAEGVSPAGDQPVRLLLACGEAERVLLAEVACGSAPGQTAAEQSSSGTA